MKALFTVLNASFLSLTSAMYLGTGWSLWLFQFQVAPKLTPATYYYAFVPQVESAGTFFTWMTSLMILSAIVMLVIEWKGGMRWVPILVIVSVTAAPLPTIWYIFPYNDAMKAGITDPMLLQTTLAKWISLNRVRIVLWSVEWVATTCYFARRTYQFIQSPQS
jgi:hypothetical protein